MKLVKVVTVAEVEKLTLEERGLLLTGIVCLEEGVAFDESKLPASVAKLYGAVEYEKAKSDRRSEIGRATGKLGGNPALKKKKPKPSTPAVKPESQNPTVASVINGLDAGEELKQALRDFSEMRTKMRKPLTAKALCMAIRELRKLSPDEQVQIQIVNQSVMKGWQSFYDLKEPDRTSTNPNSRPASESEITDLQHEYELGALNLDELFSRRKQKEG